MDRRIILGLLFMTMPFCGASSLEFSSLRAKESSLDAESSKCISDFYQKVTELKLEEGHLARMARLKDLFNEASLITFCSAYRNVSDCILNSNRTDMENGSATDLFLIGTKGIKFLCVDHFDELMLHLPCYSKTTDEVRRVCDPMCDMGGLADKVLEEEQRPRLMPRDTVLMIENLCNALSCELDCEGDVTIIICPEDPVAMVFKRKFVAESVSAIKQLLSSLPASPNSDLDYVLKRWPMQCDILSGVRPDHLSTLDDNGANSTAFATAQTGSDTNSFDNSPARLV